jgi:pyridinium-3,5-biscarboxylic acid mononucleotide synthase
VRRERTLDLLRAVSAGEVSPEVAIEEIARAPLEVLSADGRAFATVDHHRALRQGFPEVVFGEGKTPAQCVAIAERLAASGDGFLVTRASAEARAALGSRFPDAVVNPVARTVRLAGPPSRRVQGRVGVVTAGTTDLPVADEAAETLAAVGIETARLTDVGVAGVHRLLVHTDQLATWDVTIVIAGMDGALPSVVGGLVRGPVIAVPTSVGYGASFGGLSALLAMLNSCAAGVVVVNIDNGFGAAMAAARILLGQGVRTASGDRG